MRPRQLHPLLRRRICRAVFCLICLLPTTSLLAWTINRKLPSHITYCESRARDLLGLDTTIERVRYPQPGVCLYEGIDLTDPETHRRVLSCRWLELVTTGPVLTIRPAAVEVDSERAGKLVRLMMRRLLRELPESPGMVRILPTSVTLRGPHDEQTYDDVECLLEATDAGDSAALRFRLAGADMVEAATVMVSRRHGAQTQTRASLDTAGSALPVSMFAAWYDMQPVLGRDAQFQGSLWVDEDSGGWRGDATGMLTNVELESLCSARFPHLLTGLAEIEIDRARIEQGRLVEAAGRLQAGPGVIGDSLIKSAIDSLHCRAMGKAGDDITASHRNYRQLFLRFTLDAGGLRLAGLPAGPNTGAILMGESQLPLLTEPADRPLSVISLLRALVPPNQFQVPATKETAALVSWLPLPSVVPPPTTNGLPPRPSARVHLRGQ